MVGGSRTTPGSTAATSSTRPASVSRAIRSAWTSPNPRTPTSTIRAGGVEVEVLINSWAPSRGEPRTIVENAFQAYLKALSGSHSSQPPDAHSEHPRCGRNGGQGGGSTAHSTADHRRRRRSRGGLAGNSIPGHER